MQSYSCFDYSKPFAVLMHNATPQQISDFLNAPRSIVVVVHCVQRTEMTPQSKQDQLQRQRDHWAKLHTTLFSPEDFEAWVSSIPGCSTCQRDFRKLLETNPPRFDDWQRWSWEIHNAVNTNINKPILTYSDACKLWNWDLTSPNPPA